MRGWGMMTTSRRNVARPTILAQFERCTHRTPRTDETRLSRKARSQDRGSDHAPGEAHGRHVVGFDIRGGERGADGKNPANDRLDGNRAEVAAILGVVDRVAEGEETSRRDGHIHEPQRSLARYPRGDPPLGAAR